jgi:hypothetical protein
VPGLPVHNQDRIRTRTPSRTRTRRPSRKNWADYRKATEADKAVSVGNFSSNLLRTTKAGQVEAAGHVPSCHQLHLRLRRFIKTYCKKAETKGMPPPEREFCRFFAGSVTGLAVRCPQTSDFGQAKLTKIECVESATCRVRNDGVFGQAFIET